MKLANIEKQKGKRRDECNIGMRQYMSFFQKKLPVCLKGMEMEQVHQVLHTATEMAIIAKRMCGWSTFSRVCVYNGCLLDI